MPRITRPSDWNPRSIRCAFDRLRRNKPGAHQRDERQRDLAGNEQMAHVVPARAARQRRALLELGDHVGPRCLQGGREAEEDAGGQRDEHREGQDAGVEAEVDGVGLHEWRTERPEQGARPVRHEEPAEAAEQCEQHALGEELPDQPRRGWRQSRGAPQSPAAAHGHAPAAGSATLPHAISRTSATTVMPTLPESVNCCRNCRRERAVGERLQPERAAAIVGGKIALERLADGIRIGARLLERDAVLQSAPRPGT